MELNSWPSLLTSLRIIIGMSVYVAGKDFFHTFWLLRHMPVNIWIWMCVCVYICMCTTFIHRWKWTLCVHAFFSSVAQSCPTLCNPMDCSTPGFPVHHQLLELVQTHVHRVGDAIQGSCPLSSLSPPTSVIPSIRVFSNEAVLCISIGQSIGVSALASVLPMSIQDWFPLGRTGWISLQSKGLSRVFSNTTVQTHQFFSALVQLSHLYLTTGKTIALTRWTFVGKVMQSWAVINIGAVNTGA